MVCLARLRPFNVIQSQILPPKRSKTKWYHYIQDLSVMYFNTVLFKFRPNISHSWSLDCSSFGSLILLNQLHLHMVSGRRKRMLSVEFFLTNQRFFCPAIWVFNRMGSKLTAHEAKGRIGYWLRGHEGERNNCFGKIQLVGQKYRDKTTLASKMRFSSR